MKKRMLSLLVAICMIAALLPVMAIAADEQVVVNLCQVEGKDPTAFTASLTVTEGGKAAYATTDADGVPTVVTNGSVPTDNYVKLEYPQGGMPTLTLKGAYLKAFGEVVDLSKFNLDVTIVVESDSKIESTDRRGIWRMCDGDLTITGAGKLTITCYSTAISFEGAHNPGSLILKNANLDATTTDNQVGRTLSIPCGNLVIDGGTVNLTHNNGTAVWVGMGTADNKKDNGNITITGNATVNAKADNTSAYYALYCQNELKIKSGTVNAVKESGRSGCAIYAEGNATISGGTVTATSVGRAMMTDSDLTMTGGSVTLVNTNEDLEALEVGALNAFYLKGGVIEITSACAAFTEGSIPDLSMHSGYDAVAGDDNATAGAYNEDEATTYKYFKLEKGSTVGPDYTPEDTTEDTTEDTSNNTTAGNAGNNTTENNAGNNTENKGDDTDKTDKGGMDPMIWVIIAVAVVGVAAAVIIIIKKKAA